MPNTIVLWILTAVLFGVDITLLQRVMTARSLALLRAERAAIFVPKAVGYTSDGRREEIGGATTEFAILIPISSHVELDHWERIAQQFPEPKWVFVAYCMRTTECPASRERVRVLAAAPVLLARNLVSQVAKQNVIALDWKKSTVGVIRWTSETEMVQRIRALQDASSR